jgi:hypothetical protein
MNKTVRVMTAGAALALAALGPATGAFAATTPSTSSGQTSWPEVQHKVAQALQARQTTLANLTTSVQSNTYLTAGDRQALENLLRAETQGIDQLASQVDNATPQTTTIAQLRQDAYTMVHQYRVYLVMAPQVHLTAAFDTQTVIEPKIAAVEPRLQAAIGKAGNPPAAVEAYHDLLAQVTNATTATGKADIPAVLQVTPPGFPGDDGPLVAASATLHTAQGDLKAARKDIQIIRDAIH